MQIQRLMNNRLIVLAAMNMVFALACVLAQDIDNVLERVGDERPAPGTAVTLPPIWTPTVGMPPVQGSATATPDPTRIPPAQALQAPGPRRPANLVTWGSTVLYCDSDGNAALLDLQGEELGDLAIPCLDPDLVSNEEGFAVSGAQLFQFPDATIVQDLPGQQIEWSEAGNTLAVSQWEVIGGVRQIWSYKVDEARFRQLTNSGDHPQYLGISPDGFWIVYIEPAGSDRAEQAPAKVMGVSATGYVARRLYEVYDEDTIRNSVVGWVSASRPVLARSDSRCNLELLLGNFASNSANHIFGAHASAAVDPVSDTIFVHSIDDCGAPVPDGELVRLTSAGEWEPAMIEFPTALVGDHRIERVEWLDGLEMFAVWVKSKGDQRQSGIVVYSSDGDIHYVFTTYGDQPGSMGGIYPSPDGSWILVSAPSPHGTRLYDSDGTMIKAFIAGGALSEGVRAVQWTSDSSSFFMIPVEGTVIYRADGTRDWVHPRVEDSVSIDSELTLVNPPQLPYRMVCPDLFPTRLKVGDRVEVGLDPDVPSRIRQTPSTESPVLGQMDPGERGRIIEGPACGGTYTWWRIAPDGESPNGWVAEGEPLLPWLLPLD